MQRRPLTDEPSLQQLLAQADQLMYEHKCLKRLNLTPSVRNDRK
ncbi:MAG: hypothetical protein NT070_02485 [Cyanobacteria bacterium]|nr:hypothetical protein [Cyanobacteriota bacterium]